MKWQCVMKVLSDSPGMVNFTVELVDSILTCPSKYSSRNILRVRVRVRVKGIQILLQKYCKSWHYNRQKTWVVFTSPCTPPPRPPPSNLNRVSDKHTYFFINIQCFNCVWPPSPPISLSLEDDMSSLLLQSILSSSSSSSISPPT